MAAEFGVGFPRAGCSRADRHGKGLREGALSPHGTEAEDQMTKRLRGRCCRNLCQNLCSLLLSFVGLFEPALVHVLLT